MDSAIFSSLGSIGFTVGAVAAPIALALLAAFIRWRTGSSATILSRLWTLFHGKPSATAPAIKEYLDKQAAVLQLSFITGLKVRTEHHAARLIEWAVKHDENLSDAARCGPYFDTELPGLKDRSEQPKKPFLIFVAGLFLLLVLSTMASSFLVLYDKPLLRLKATGTWLSLTADGARPLPFGRTFAFNRCKAQSPGDFTLAETRSLCELFAALPAEERKTYIRRTLAEQRANAAFLTAVLLTQLCPFILFFGYIGNANRMRERLRKNAQHRQESPVGVIDLGL